PTIEEARRQIMTLNATLKGVAQQEGIALVSAGTHPHSYWQEQKTTPHKHYEALEEKFQDLERALVIYGLHVTELGCIESSNDLCWDIRPHLAFRTLEFRICDMPASSRDTLALAALCQALIMKLLWLYHHHRLCSPVPRDYLEENKWQAMRYGLDASIIDFAHRRRMPMRDALH